MFLTDGPVAPYECGGCLGEHPHPACACCGNRTTVVILTAPHTLSLCDRCHLTLLACRAEAVNRAMMPPLRYVYGAPPPPPAPPVPRLEQGALFKMPPVKQKRQRRKRTTKAPAA